jgi:type VI secretion system protein ImpJ
MRTLSRVVWSEGMHLGPQHFQAQNRYFEHLVHFTTDLLSFEPWGLAAVQVDTEALRNGVLSLVHARGLFPDGLVFLIPEADAPPRPRQLNEVFPPTIDRLDMYLAVAPLSDRGANVSDPSFPAPGTRFRSEEVLLADELTGLDSKIIRMGAKNLRLMAETERKDEPAIPIARVRREGSGQYALDPKFIPPLLQIQASERVMVLLRRLVEILEDKSRTIVKPKDLSAGTAAGFSAQGISNAWFLHCVNASLSPLRHIEASRSTHPEELYREMARLAGALCTFGLDSHPASLPLYNHSDLTECFDALDHHIRTHLELVVPSNCVEIPLTRRAAYFWEGQITDARTLVHSRWIFAIRSNIGEADVISGTPRLVKICSKEFLPKLVQRALPGLQMTHMPVAPPAVSPRVDFQYFGLDKAGPCWDHMVATKELAIYVPGELPDPDIQLMAVLES